MTEDFAIVSEFGTLVQSRPPLVGNCGYLTEMNRGCIYIADTCDGRDSMVGLI